MTFMRAVCLLILTILFPAFAYAANPPVLTTYTLSHDTIYPGATFESGLATTTSIDIAFSEQVKASIKIVSSGGSLVKSLYSSSGVTNPTPKIWDGTTTDGARAADGTYTILISATSTAMNVAMSDSSRMVVVAASGTGSTDAPADAMDTPVAPSVGSSPPEYIPIPTLRIVTTGTRTVSSGADTAFTTVVYDGRGNRRDEATVTWSFGDGMRRTGASVYHKYYEPGEYIAVVRATTSDGGDERSEMIVTVKNAGISIAAVSPRGITLTNTDVRLLDISLWRLSAGGKEFKIPEDTQILAGRTVLFPSQVIDLPFSGAAALLYPGGEVAAVYPKPAPLPEQPFTPITGFNIVQKVNPITSTNRNIQTHEDAVVAPTAQAEPAAVGAVAAVAEAPIANKEMGIFRSPWTLGLLGVILLAGSAFILL